MQLIVLVCKILIVNLVGLYFKLQGSGFKCRTGTLLHYYEQQFTGQVGVLPLHFCTLHSIQEALSGTMVCNLTASTNTIRISRVAATPATPRPAPLRPRSPRLFLPSGSAPLGPALGSWCGARPPHPQGTVRTNSGFLHNNILTMRNPTALPPACPQWSRPPQTAPRTGRTVAMPPW